MRKTKYTSDAVPIRLLGDPLLREVAKRVDDVHEPVFARSCDQLYATLMQFRQKHKFGRAIAAPQVGNRIRLIVMHLKGERNVIVNPEITWESAERFTMWDDCMSFPSLLVRVERARSISVHFQNERGEERDWEHLEIATAELLQHEIDHLNGVLAIDRAIDKESIVLRDTYVIMTEHFRKLVDYEIASPSLSG